MGLVVEGLTEVDAALNANLRRMAIQPLKSECATSTFEYHTFPGIGMSLSVLRFGTEVRIVTESSVDFIPIQVPLGGSAHMRVGSRVLPSNPDRGCTLGSSRRVTVETSADWEIIICRLERRPVERRLEQLLGRPLESPIAFQASIDLTSPFGMQLRSMLCLLLHQARDDNSLLIRGMTARDAEQLLIATFLHAQPHNYTEALYASQYTAMPRCVQKALDYLQANLRNRVTISHVAGEVGIGERSLQRAFNQYLDTTPMAYLKEQRLQAARRSLKAITGSGSVTQIALQYGFNHLGRFAEDYRERFGESPSVTLSSGAPGLA